MVQNRIVAPPNVSFSLFSQISIEVALVIGAQAIWERNIANRGFLSPKSRRRNLRTFARNKKDGSVVTDGDVRSLHKGAQLVQLRRKELDGDIKIFGEESMKRFKDVSDIFIHHEDYPEVVNAERVLIIDSVNNTRDYALGLANWDVITGGLEHGRIVHGVHYSPEERNCLCVAERGVGTFISRGPEYNLKKVVPPKPWKGEFSKLRVGHGYSIAREPRYRALWDYLVNRGVETHEIVSTSAGLVAACEWCDVYIHGFTFGHDIVAGMAALQSMNRKVQLFQDLKDGNGPKLLPGLPARVFNPLREDLSVEICGGNRLAVKTLTQLWVDLVKDYPSQSKSLSAAG